MRAVLWDGIKQLPGNLSFGEKSLDIAFDDFTKTNLGFCLEYKSIIKIELVRVYEIAEGGVVITSKDDRRDVFVVDDPQKLKRMIEKRMD